MNYLKKLNILPLYSQYIFYILLFVVLNRGLFKTNSDVHNFNTRPNFDLHFPIARLTVFKKGVCYSGIKMYNHLPLTFMQLSYDVNKTKSAVNRFLLINSAYSLQENFRWK